MPQFRFRIDDGATDHVASDCASDHAGRVKAVRLCAERLGADPEILLWSEDVKVTVFDATGRQLFSVLTSARAKAAA